MIETITDAMLVQKYRQLEAHVTTQEKALDTALKPYRDGMAVIKNEFLRRFNERGSTNSKTEFGTPYKSTIMNVKVVDRDMFLKQCLEHWNVFGGEMLQVGATKDAVKQFIDAGHMPETLGLEISHIDRINMPKG
jgi:hypothetical protein